ncbi:kinesin-like protein KIF27 isoform X1 [Haliotis rufescens]|uniref:kinesin-like protein KIF27 isoform X1 n=1 Tax=Haliotis rufescens TaxID=6454 RepID=UPI00201EBE83|nr:kinesin-like protein KIF27 isoform X1 [Haliotis rufescens]
MQEVNVRVAVRVRPLLPKERLGGDQMCVQVLRNTNQLIVGKDRAFTFDHVFNHKTSQEDVYQTCVDPLVRSIFDGYNATVFAYGQTGSGKTYTIGGCNISAITEDEHGTIPRAINQMFDIMKSNEAVEFSITVSYIEIYKEELQDLLDVDKCSKDLHVREDDQGNTVIIGVKEVECETLDDVMSLLESGSAARHTGSTQMNEHSSRSHSIFTIVIGQKWCEDDVLASRRSRHTSDSSDILEDDASMSHTMAGKFHFVDLAGSERAHRTGNVGDRFKESIHINTGLLSLGNVISALGDPKKKSTHIPYRESKITRLLKDSLGGNAQTLMICCISPASANFDESLNALKYANRAKNIRNKPIVNRDIQSIRFEEMQSEIKALREELVRQRTSVVSAGRDTSVERTQQDCDLIQDLEVKVVRLQTECSHYRMVSEEAYKQLMDIKEREILSKSQDIRLKDWLDLMEEIKNRVPSTLSRESLDNQTIRDLESELRKCRDDLRSDEDIFAEKTREVNHLAERIEELEKEVAEGNAALKTSIETCQRQEQQMLEQQLKIQELQRALKPDIQVVHHEVDQQSPLFQKKHFLQGETLLGASSVLDSTAVTSSAPPVTGRRPKSVPTHINRKQDNFYSSLRPPSRNIKTSPALFSLERVMQSFRARSQLLVTRLEDSDEVLHQTFSDDQENQQPGTGDSNFVRRGTFRVKKGSRNDEDKENRLSVDDMPEVRRSKPVSDVRTSTRLMRSLDMSESDGTGSRLINIDNRSSTEIHRKKIKQTQLKVLEANQKMRDLAINIRMKEQLIRELVRSGKDAELMNKQYADKIKALEKEKLGVKQELVGTQRALQELGMREQQESVEKQKLQSEYRKKIEEAKSKMSALQKKQKETEKIANFASQHEKKIQDLELAVDRMKQHYENLQRRFKDETDQKAKLEREMQRELQRVKELELKSEQQQKILKRKNEEIAAAQRRLRSGSLPPIQMENLEKMDEQKRWLDSEIEKVLVLRRQNEELQEDLNRREGIVAKKEAMLSEKSELEIKKLRSSQMINHDVVSMSLKLENVEKKIEEKRKELSQAAEDEQENVKEEISRLKRSREKLQKSRGVMDEKLREGSILSAKEERRLIELDEAIEALDAAIEYKNESIHNRQAEIRHSQIQAQSEDNLMNRLKSLTTVETKSLLSKYFEKVVSLREEERKLVLQCDELEVKIDEQERIIRELESTLQRSNMDSDRRLVQQQREYEQKMQLLMHQVTEGGVGNSCGDGIDLKVQQLEKDLYYYKKTSRDLKKKFKELITKGVLSSQAYEDIGVYSSIQSNAENEVSTPRAHVPTPRDTHSSRDSHIRPGSGRERPPSRPVSSRSAHKSSQDQPHNAATPVKISRKDLRPMTEEEVSMRRSHLSRSVGPATPQDSLDSASNPWS